jgi:ATP-dependent helicase/nuclease subunit A
LAAASFYEKAHVLPEGKARPMSLEASKLRYKPQDSQREAPKDNSGLSFQDSLDTLLEKAGLEPADFGSLVHAVLEARLNDRSFLVPQKILSRIDEEKALQKIMAFAEVMAGGFLTSDLGKRLAASSYRESEFPVITSITIEGKAIAIMGQIDLLFEEAHELVIVDFKTDKVEKSEDHYGQLAAYYRAAGDIFGKPASVWLFYLRSSRAVNITDNVKGLSLEELAAEAFAHGQYTP